MRNKPLPGMMKHSPMKQTKGPVMPKDHPVTPPTEGGSKKSKGTLRETHKVPEELKFSLKNLKRLFGK